MVHTADRMRAGTGMGWLERWWEAWVHENRHLEGWACCKSLCRSMNYPAGHCESQLIQNICICEEYLRACCWKYDLLNSNSKIYIYLFIALCRRQTWRLLHWLSLQLVRKWWRWPNPLCRQVSASCSGRTFQRTLASLISWPPSQPKLGSASSLPTLAQLLASL